jgi:hypothetical protein
MFNTCGKRIESIENVVDWEQPVYPKWIYNVLKRE